MFGERFFNKKPSEKALVSKVSKFFLNFSSKSFLTSFLILKLGLQRKKRKIL